MITLDTLRAYGADADEGLARCINKEDFYLRLVNSILSDNRLDALENAIIRGDLDAAFETAHALKGMYANLSLTPLLKPIEEMTELLRNRTNTDYSALLAEAKAQFAKLCSL